MPTYRIFVQDVGRSGYSCAGGRGSSSIVADSPAAAIEKKIAQGGCQGWEGKFIALPYSRRDLWPDGQTGKVPKEALLYR